MLVAAMRGDIEDENDLCFSSEKVLELVPIAAIDAQELAGRRATRQMMCNQLYERLGPIELDCVVSDDSSAPIIHECSTESTAIVIMALRRTTLFTPPFTAVPV